MVVTKWIISRNSSHQNQGRFPDLEKESNILCICISFIAVILINDEKVVTQQNIFLHVLYVPYSTLQQKIIFLNDELKISI